MLKSNALYYPFSRCIDSTVVKQLLLQFDSITFLDPVDDDDWRSQLFEDVEYEDRRYAAYRDLGDAMPWLRKTGVINVCSPDSLRSVHADLTVAATLSDLADQSWVAEADPVRFGLPTQQFGGKPCWNVFKPKLPDGVLDALDRNAELRQHLLSYGGEHYASHLSYAAGSSVGINVHLAAADELSLAPVTDSRLHHYLMLRKLQRSNGPAPNPVQADELTGALAQRTVFKVIEAILPAHRLDHLSLEDILQFRRETQTCRNDFLLEVSRVIAAEVDPAKAVDGERIAMRVTNQLTERARTYGAELNYAGQKLWPKLIDGLVSPVPVATAAAALAASYITNSGYVLAASLLLHALGPVKAAAEWRAEKNRAEQSANTSIAYLSQVHRLAATA